MRLFHSPVRSSGSNPYANFVTPSGSAPTSVTTPKLYKSDKHRENLVRSNASSLSGLLKPFSSKSQMQLAQQHLCQDFPTKAGLEEAAKIFSRLARRGKGQESYKAKAWLGVTRRLQNRSEAYQILSSLHQEDPQDRLVFLNMVASYIMFRKYDSTDIFTISYLQEKLSSHNDEHPDDFYAHLLAIMLDRPRDRGHEHTAKIIAALESLYLRNPNYTPTTAFLSYCLWANHYEGGPVDYAQEALAKDYRNTFAAKIAYNDLHTYWEKFPKRDPYGHVNYPVHSLDGHSLLVTSYNLQDPPDYRSTNQTLRSR